jgi:hypothetical protein
MKVPSKMQWVSFGALVAAAGFIAYAMASGEGVPMGMWLYCLAPYVLAAGFVLVVGAALAWPLLYVVLKARRRLQ